MGMKSSLLMWPLLLIRCHAYLEAKDSKSKFEEPQNSLVHFQSPMSINQPKLSMIFQFM